MANNIVQLTDDAGNNIFPIAGGMASNSITTGMIQDDAVTASKIAQYAANNAIPTPNDLSPSEDTPSSWYSLLEAGGANYQGFYITRYATLGKFTHQPSQFGNLMTINNGNDMVQIWFRYNDRILYRVGTVSGWKRPSDGSWATILDDIVSTGTITMASGHTADNRVLKKTGNVVSWGISFTDDSDITANASHIIATIPSGFRPATSAVGSGYTVTGEPFFVRVWESGNVVVTTQSNLMASRTKLVGGTYIV